MSDIFVSSGLPVDRNKIAKSLSWTPRTKSWTGEIGDLSWVVTRVDDPALWAPARDPESGVCVILGGRIAPEEAGWKAAEGLPYEGGLACRLVLDHWLRGGARAVESLNGGAQMIVIDEKKRELHCRTDRMGFYPAFTWDAGGFLLCSHPDVAAAALEDAGRPCDFDPVTMAEFLRTGTATHPHTYWHGIRQLDAGTRHRFEFGSPAGLRESSVYWRPANVEGAWLANRGEIVERLAGALLSSVRRRTLPRLGKVALLLSAGADSRTALFGANEPSAVNCFTFYDEVNTEFTNAKKLAGIAGAPHEGYQRGKDYYFEHAPEAVRITGGMWSMDSAHYSGLLPRLSGANFGVVLTGCYADYLFKGLAYNRRRRSVHGKTFPLYTLCDVQHQFYQPFASLSDEWTGRVTERLDRRFAGLAGGSDRTAAAAEFLRLSPIVREADAAGRLLLRHTAAFDPFTSDNDVLEIAGAMHPSQKLNGVPFGMAVERVTGPRAKEVLNNNYGAPVGASELTRVTSFLLSSLKRKISGQGGGQPFERDPNSVATAGSWPYFPRVIKFSQRLRDWRSALPGAQEDFLFGVLGEDRRRWSIEEWADRDHSLFMRLYTASLWLSQNPGALGRVRAVRA